MAQNYIQKGHVLTLTAPANVTSGGVVVIGEIVGIAQGDAAATAPVDVAVTGCWSISKVAADAISTGELVYWDATAGLATDDDDEGANALLGYAIADAPATSGSVNVRLAG